MNLNTLMFIRYVVFLLLFGIGLWQTLSGKTTLGSALMAGAIATFIVQTRKRQRIRQMEAQGINVYDERAWFIAGRAAYFSYVTFTLASAFVVLIGSVWGSQALVNPYNFLGVCMSLLVLLYVCFYYYFSYRT